MKKKIISSLIAVIMVLTATLGTACADTKTLSFKDVNDKYWAKPNIDILVEKGGISGYPDGTFKPANTITAGEFVKIALYLLPDVKIENEITGSDWYKPYAEKAIEVGIVPDSMFDSSTWKKPISRQKMAVISIKVATALGEDMNIESKEALTKKFSDYDSICQYCKESVINAVGKGIVGGYPDGTFKPEGNATRAEATAMLVRVIDATQRLAVGTTDDLTGCTETVKYKVGDRIYEVPYVSYTMAEMGIVKTYWEDGWLKIYTTTPVFFYAIKEKNGKVATAAVLNVRTNLTYFKDGNYFVYEYSAPKEGYAYLKTNSEGIYYMVDRNSTINGIYFPEITAVRISDMTFNN